MNYARSGSVSRIRQSTRPGTSGRYTGSCILLVYHLKVAFIVYDLTISEYLVKV